MPDVATAVDSIRAADSPPPHRRLTARASERVALVALLIGTAVMYLWDITINGMGNQFYAAAAQAGSKNWEALLFGSLDVHNFISVDKPPASQWVMALSGQIFGFGSASMLIPEAFMGVAGVGLLYGAVRRISGPWAALLAGAALALTPVAALMFRYNNPDAVMVLLMIAAAYCAVRALERAGWRWIALAGVALGLAFLAKMLEGLMVMPAIGLVYLVAAPTSLRRRLLHLLGGLAAFVASAGWFVVLTLVWPASSRPYIAGSTDNNFMDLVLGYNGFSRVLGHNHPGFKSGEAVGASAGTHIQRGDTHHFDFVHQVQGWRRLFSGEFGFEIGWLIVAALLALVLVFIARGRAPRTDRARAGAILFGGWMVFDGLVLSFMRGMVLPYYSLSLAPAVAGMFAVGVHEMWRCRASRFGWIGLAALISAAGLWSWWILGRDSAWLPPLRWIILVVTLASVITVLSSRSTQARGRLTVAAVTVGLVGALAGSAAYAIATIGQRHTGGLVFAGPATTQPFIPFWQDEDNPQLAALLRTTRTEWSAAILRSSPAASLELSTDTAVMALGGFQGVDPVPTLGQFQRYVAEHRIAYYIVPKTGNGPGPRGYGSERHADIADWVEANFTPTRVGPDTVYDLRDPATPRPGRQTQ